MSLHPPRSLAILGLALGCTYLVVHDAGHHIQLDRPEVVVAAVHEVVDSVRRKRRLDAAALSAKVD